MTPALCTKALSKTYSNGFEALKAVDLKVEKGDFFALLGSNGAGKTTAIGIICGLINSSSGFVEVDGLDQRKNVRDVKRKIGLMPQEFNFNPHEPNIEILINQAGYFGINRKDATIRAEELLKKVNLWGRRREVPQSLSGGMKRRLMLARALMHNPDILILDEPTAGVDVEIRRSMWHFLKQLNREGLTIILTTHYLEEAESMCRNIAILDEGEIVAQSSMKALLKKAQHQVLIFECVESLPDTIRIKNCECEILDEYSLQVSLPESTTISDVVTKLFLQNISVANVRLAQNRLENLFLSLTSKAN